VYLAAHANQVYTAYVNGKPQATLKSCGIHRNTNRLYAPPTFILWSLVSSLSKYYVMRNEYWSKNVKGRDNLQDLGTVCSYPCHLFHVAYKCHTHVDLKPRYSALPSIASVQSFDDEINASVLDWLRSDARTLLVFVKYLLSTAFRVSCGLSFLHTLRYFSFCTLLVNLRHVWVNAK
jgi:hypothetical protein